jgi:hypothetical protein
LAAWAAARGIEPVVTDETDVSQAALAYSRGALPDLTNRLH